MAESRGQAAADDGEDEQEELSTRDRGKGECYGGKGEILAQARRRRDATLGGRLRPSGS